MLYIKILDYLSGYGIAVNADISQFLNKKTDKDLDDSSNDFISYMVNSKHIICDIEYSDIIYLPDGSSSFDNAKIKCVNASITYLGMDYITKYNLDLKTKKSLKNQFVIGIVSVILLAISIFLSAKLIINDQSVNDNVYSLQSQLHTQQLTLQRIHDSLAKQNKLPKKNH